MDGSGNVYVTGFSYGAGNDYATIKYNSSGAQQWVSRYSSGDVAYSLAVDGSGNVYVTGWSPSNYATIKYNTSGVQQWVAIYNGPGNSVDYAYSLAVDGSGNVYVTGESRGSGTAQDYATIKYNSSGVQQWVQRYNGPGNDHDEATSLAVDGSGNVYVTGESRSGTTSSTTDYATIKYNSSGVQQWVQRYNGPGNNSDYALSLAVDGSGNVCVTGTSVGSGTDYDYATIKYSLPVGITPISNQIPESFQLEQNYPNPFNPVTKIKFDLPQFPLNKGGERGLFVRLLIYDILGREIETLVNQHLHAGAYEVSWDADNFPSGVYYYELSAGEFRQTNKMVLVK